MLALEGREDVEGGRQPRVSEVTKSLDAREMCGSRETNNRRRNQGKNRAGTGRGPWAYAMAKRNSAGS